MRISPIALSLARLHGRVQVIKDTEFAPLAADELMRIRLDIRTISEAVLQILDILIAETNEEE
ncbi:MAG: hypothetical protein UY48_C0011G0026 [Candidatus Gottesmanbacteria bacterium GW2011_GWB1_49_7]|uniref:Uncharacterized protein n=1 Tax=Candidatus Gottesmanbacteria bacterium GW2011_GWB1_49_7 TaxID=1618448 RepID=A0A0G1Z1J9_9BACT|nr:MAG: hypothetical protein UY48_C0011G0026 [Candidatus Gottesmanbacteria bacterium GW2011_GWB1_49_7]